MKSNFPNRRFFSWFAFGLLIVLLGFIPVRIAVTFREFPTSQAIFVLGGNFERTKFAGEFWQSRKDLDIWVMASPRFANGFSAVFRSTSADFKEVWCV